MPEAGKAMTPDRWKRVESIYHVVRQGDRSDQDRFLDQACAGDEDLRREVESLLNAGAAASRFLAQPALEVHAYAIAGDRESFQPGQQLGPYELVSRLGAGGMGEVWRARDPALRREVAIKVLLPMYAAEPERLLRFEREARAVAMLSHPNVLVVYAVGTDRGRPYLVTELLEGESLRELIQRGAVAPKKAIDIAVQIAKGLSAAHDRGLVHRDLKPENVFLTRDRLVKILDFGLAKLNEPDTSLDSSLTRSGVLLGTPRYMSPEQARGEEVDRRSDIFSLGAILYEMLAGRPAVHGGSPVEVLLQVMNASTPELDTGPTALRRVVARCMEKDVKERFHSAQDLAFQLELLREPEQASQPAPTAPPVPAPAAPVPRKAAERPSPTEWKRRAIRQEEQEPARGDSKRWAVGILMMLVAGAGIAYFALVPGGTPEPAIKPNPPTAPHPAPPDPSPPAPPPPPPETSRPEPAPPPPAGKGDTGKPDSNKAAPPKSAPVATVNVLVRTTPPGARLRSMTNPLGEISCVTPCVVMLPQSKQGKQAMYLLYADHPQLGRTFHNVTLTGEQDQVVTFPLLGGCELKVESTPPQATVTVDGVRHPEKTPTTVRVRGEGIHTFAFSFEGRSRVDQFHMKELCGWVRLWVDIP